MILHKVIDSATEGTKWQEKVRKTNRGDADSRVSEVEELVYARNDDGEKQADYPSTEGRHGHCGIVSVGYCGSDFRVRGFILGSDGRRVKIGVVGEGLRFSPSM